MEGRQVHRGPTNGMVASLDDDGWTNISQHKSTGCKPLWPLTRRAPIQNLAVCLRDRLGMPGGTRRVNVDTDLVHGGTNRSRGVGLDEVRAISKSGEDIVEVGQLLSTKRIVVRVEERACFHDQGRERRLRDDEMRLRLLEHAADRLWGVSG